MNAQFATSQHDPENNDTLDAEHQSLFLELERFLLAATDKDNNEQCAEIISRIGLQLATHFAHEESYMLRTGLCAEHCERHRLAHTEILEDFVSLQLDLMSGNAIDLSAIQQDVTRWIKQHLTDFDCHISNMQSQQAA